MPCEAKGSFQGLKRSGMGQSFSLAKQAKNGQL
jgi:hypothetical protein